MEINVIESSTGKSKSTEGKKKTKGKSKQKFSSKEKPAKNEPTNDKRKPHYPSIICNEDHYTKECPHQEKVSKFIKGSPTPAVLKDPFPSQDSKMVSHNTSSSSISQDIMMMSSQQVMVATRLKDYGSKGLVGNGNEANSFDKPSNSIHPPPYEPLQIEKPNPDMMI